MKKEVFFAIVFGLVVGLIITVGMYRARRALDTVPSQSPEPFLTTSVEETPLPTGEESLLRIREPAPELSTQQSTISITGTTLASTPIIVLHNEKELITTSDAQGNFSLPVTLVEGANIFTIRVLPSDRAPLESVRTVVYEPSQIATPSATPRL